MLFKKILVAGAAIALMNFTYATPLRNLVTTNNTTKPSTVKVLGVCVGMLQPPFRVVTPAGGVSNVDEANVYRLCHGKVGTCVANIHMTENCSDAPVATAYFDLGGFSLARVDKTPGAPYEFVNSGSSLTINPA